MTQKIDEYDSAVLKERISKVKTEIENICGTMWHKYQIEPGIGGTKSMKCAHHADMMMLALSHLLEMLDTG